MKLVIDISHYQKLNYDVVAPQIDGAIVRVAFGTSPDPVFRRHYDELRASKVPVAAYQWFRPDQDVKAQIETVKRALDGTDVNLVFSDQEQHTPYGLPLPVYSPDKLSTLGQSHVSGLQTHGYEVGVYSRATWISAQAKPMLGWLYNYHVWLASWPYSKEQVSCSWEVLKSQWMPKVFSPYFTSDWPADKKRADAWQWSGDKFILPGVRTEDDRAPRSVDLNFVSDALLAKFNKQAAPPTTDVDLPALCSELDDLYNSMLTGKLEIDERLLKDIRELEFIRSLIKE